MWHQALKDAELKRENDELKMENDVTWRDYMIGGQNWVNIKVWRFDVCCRYITLLFFSFFIFWFFIFWFCVWKMRYIWTPSLLAVVLVESSWCLFYFFKCSKTRFKLIIWFCLMLNYKLPSLGRYRKYKKSNLENKFNSLRSGLYAGPRKLFCEFCINILGF